MACQVLVMGATYGSLLGTKLLLAGHRVHLICLPDEADLINIEGTIVRMTPNTPHVSHIPIGETARLQLTHSQRQPSGMASRVSVRP